MASPKTLLVDGTDIQSLTGILVTSMELYAPGTRRGSNETIPGRQGQVGAQLPYDAYAFSVGVVVEGADEAAMEANLRAAGTLLAGTNGLVALTRRLAKVGGGYDSHTANGQFVSGLGFALLNLETGQTDLQFVNLSGAWWDGTNWLVP